MQKVAHRGVLDHLVPGVGTKVRAGDLKQIKSRRAYRIGRLGQKGVGVGGIKSGLPVYPTIAHENSTP